MAIVLTASQWHMVYKFVLVWLPIYVLTKHSVAWFSPYSLPVGFRVHHSLYLTQLFCSYDVLVWFLKHIWCVWPCCKEGSTDICILGHPWEMGVLDCKQSIFPLMDYACCRSLFFWDAVLHQLCPTFWDSVVVFYSGVMYAGHFWHQNGSTIFVTVR